MNIKNYTSEVPAEKSVLELENTLIKMGATAISKEYEKGKIVCINFAIVKEGNKIPFKLPSRVNAIQKLFLNNLKSPTERQKQNAVKQAERTAWKNMKEWVQLQYAMIILEQVEFMEVFMPYVLNIESGKTMFEHYKEGGFKTQQITTMKSIDFPGAYLKIGGTQEQYHTIHAFPLDGEEGEVVAIYELTEEEIRQIVETKKIFYSRFTFHNQTVCKHCDKITPTGFQPMLISTTPIPFKAKLTFDNGEVKEVEAEVGVDGVVIHGYTQTADGRYTKN